MEPPVYSLSMPSTESPLSFHCPITQEVMDDPVMVSYCGHTFERVAIEQWITQRHSCPIDRKELSSQDLRPDLVLKRAIEDWKKTMGRN
jgi:SUMO ligase MMS21 Smc5/6 complex component